MDEEDRAHPTAPEADDAAPTPGPQPAARRRSPRSTLLIFLGVIGWIIVALYGIAALKVAGDVPPGTSVQGLAIAGMTPDAAATRLERTFAAQEGAPVLLEVAGSEHELDPADAGLSVDWEATVANADRLVLNPVTLARHLFGIVAVEPVTTVDEEKLNNALSALAARTDRPVVEPAISFTAAGKPQLTPGIAAQTLDVDATADAIATAWYPRTGAPIVAAVEISEPTVSAAAATRALSTVAKPAVSGPVTLTAAGEDLEVSPRTIAGSLSFAAADGQLAASVDGAALRRALADEVAAVERAPVDARIVISNGRPRVISSTQGRTVTNEALSAAAMSAMMATDPDDRVATAAVTQEAPAFTTADAKALGITEQLSSFRQWFPPAAYRYQNVGQAAAYLNGTIIKPGETFSMNDTIHERTAANGYTKGFIISGGRFREEQGGGVSIITTATWTAGFYAGLERVESHAHGLYIDRYQAGLEATVAWGLLDLKLRNDTGHGVMITAARDSGGVRVSFWGTRVYDKVTATFSPRSGYTAFTTIRDSGERCVPSDGLRGFSISVTRHLYSGGRQVSAETIPTRYKPTPHVICSP